MFSCIMHGQGGRLQCCGGPSAHRSGVFCVCLCRFAFSHAVKPTRWSIGQQTTPPAFTDGLLRASTVWGGWQVWRLQRSCMGCKCSETFSCSLIFPLTHNHHSDSSGVAVCFLFASIMVEHQWKVKILCGGWAPLLPTCWTGNHTPHGWSAVAQAWAPCLAPFLSTLHCPVKVENAQR